MGLKSGTPNGHIFHGEHNMVNMMVNMMVIMMVIMMVNDG